jgi:hypothetical protein
MFVVDILLLISQLIRRVYVCVYNQHEIEGKKYFKKKRSKGNTSKRAKYCHTVYQCSTITFTAHIDERQNKKVRKEMQ